MRCTGTYDFAGAMVEPNALWGGKCILFVTTEGDPRGQFAVAGYEVYDGRGSMRSVVTSSSNGRIDRNVRTGGMYTVDADCTGTVEYSDGTRYDLFLAPDGSTFVFIQTNPGTVAAGFEPRDTARRVRD